MLSERKRLKAEMAERKEVVDEIENELCAMLGEAEVATVNGTEVCSWKSSVRHSLDTRAFKAAHPAIAKEFEKETPVRTFRTKDAPQEATT